MKKQNPIQQVVIATDGACAGNPGPGGYAALLRFGKHEKLVAGAAKLTTNNRMELAAVIEGLSALKSSCQVEVVSDSKYVIDGFTKWRFGWIKRNWKTAAGGPVANVDLWQKLIDVSQYHDLSFTWVKGHNGHPDNERVDEAARDKCELGERLTESTIYCAPTSLDDITPAI